MELIWKYVIKITDDMVYDVFKQKYGIEVPEDIQELTMKANAGTPSNINIKDVNGNNRIFGAVLSYNNSDDDNVYTAMEIKHNNKYIPFAVDPFGSYFYENILLGNIVWINHENGEIVHIADSLEEMLESLY